MWCSSGSLGWFTGLVHWAGSSCTVPGGGGRCQSVGHAWAQPADLTTSKLLCGTGREVDSRGSSLALSEQTRRPVTTRGTFLGVLVADVLEGVVAVRVALGATPHGVGEPVVGVTPTARGTTSTTSTTPEHGEQRLGVGSSTTTGGTGRGFIGSSLLLLWGQAQDLLAD